MKTFVYILLSFSILIAQEIKFILNKMLYDIKQMQKKTNKSDGKTTTPPKSQQNETKRKKKKQKKNQEQKQKQTFCSNICVLLKVKSDFKYPHSDIYIIFQQQTERNTLLYLQAFQ